MTESLHTLARLAAAALDRTSAVNDDTRSELLNLKAALRSAVVRDSFIAPPTRDYAAILESALAAAPGRALAALAQALRLVRHQLPWTYHYAPRPGEEDLANRIAFAELIGPDGPMNHASARVGLTLVAPTTLYPAHAHPAVELYWIISGHARWTSTGADKIVPPGELVLHRSHEPHAMQTLEAPLLALWSWSGDIDTPAFYI